MAGTQLCRWAEAPLPGAGEGWLQGSLWIAPATTWVGVGTKPSRSNWALVHSEALSSNVKTGAGVWQGGTLISVGPKSWITNRGSKHIRAYLAWFGQRKHLCLPLI